MPTQSESALTAKITGAAREAGLFVLSTETGSDFNHKPTTRYRLGLTADAPADRTLLLELSDSFELNRPELVSELNTYLRENARRLQNPRPDVYVSVHGLPIAYQGFAWPFHRSTSGADTYIVHGDLRLEDGQNSPLHAKVSASMTVTFAEIVLEPEQPFAEGFIYNAIRKTLDQGQIELLKSGNRQPVPVTTRYYSRWKKQFVFTDTTAEARADYIASKVYWLSGVLGGKQPVWIADPRDAQYLNTTTDELLKVANDLARQGAIALNGDVASATDTLMGHAAHYQATLEATLAAIKPAFNEDMRQGHTNM